MITRTDILAYAQSTSTFSCRELLSAMTASGKKSSPNSVNTRLAAMVQEGILQKISRGVYQKTSISTKIFVPDYNEEMCALDTSIKNAFPFTEYCVWNISNVKRLAHHVANLEIIFVDVEAVAVESVFNHLNSYEGRRQIYFRPTTTDYERYIIGRPTLVLRPLVSQAPLSKSLSGQKSASLEKILVDVALDDDFFGFQGSQLYDIYESAFERYSINRQKLLRYAGRRGRRDSILQILHECNIQL
jgi:hypothetical protein